MPDIRKQLDDTLSGAYTLDHELSGGGMSRVFVATETALDRKIVVKVLPYESGAAVSADRFSRGDQGRGALAASAHRAAAQCGPDARALPYYTMPFVKGESLRERLERTGELAVNEGIRVLRDVAAALAYAHSEGVVHRDIKPANVMLSGGVAVVTDFGVAKAYDAAAESKDGGGLTSIGVALGTPAYMSPEQASADPNVDHRADIYSFGVMAYEVLGGSVPFANRTPAQLLAAHVKDAPEPLDKRRPSLPTALTRLVMRCLEKRPADRPQTADEIVRELDTIATSSGGTTPTNPPLPVGSIRNRVIMGAAFALVLAVVLFVALRFSRRGVAASTGRSIAVLPFANLGGDKSNDFFSEGITEEITGALAKLPGLHVPARSVSTAAAKKEPDVQKAGAQLGVDAVLQGTVQRAGDRVRIGVQLINVADGLHLWSEQYDGDMKDVFRVQDSIAKAIVGAMRVTLGANGKHDLVRTATEDPEAHNLYLQGVYLWNRRTPSTMPQAIAFLERAVQRDSTYARAYAMLALAQTVSPDYMDIDAPGAVARAIASANRALALDSSIVEAYTAIGNARTRLFENAAADSAYRMAIQVDSTFATAWHWRALLFDHVGKMDEAIRYMRRARELDPTSLIIATNVGFVLLHARRFAEADSALRKAIEQDPTFSNAHRHLGSVLLATRRYDEGIAEARRSLELQSGWLSAGAANLAYAFAVAGRTTEARATLTEILDHAKHESVSKAPVAVIYSTLGETDTAIKWLKEAVDEHDASLHTNTRDVRYDKLRADPRGAALLARTERF